jgi:predicted RNA binding protein YcfA (HicA-like mRNA interferase family)
VSPSGRRLPSAAEQLVRALKRAGWYEVKQQGSHLRLRHDEHPADIQIPMHRGDVPKGTVMALIKQAGLTQVEFRELL